MSDDEVIELWHERAAIIEEGCSNQVEWRYRSAQWRRWEANRLAYWDIRKHYGIERMPKETATWQRERRPE